MAEISGQSAILIQDYPAKGLDESMIFYRNDALAFAKAAANNNIPAAICSTIPENFDKETRELLIAHGVAPMQGIHEALNAISQAVTWKKNKSDILKNKPLEIIQGTSNLNNLYVLDEFEGKSLLKKMGFSVPKGSLASKDFASKYATELGFPVVLKMVGTKIIHKTEVGAVTLNLNSTLEVSKALIEMNQSVHANFPEGVSESYLVEKMVKLPIAELIIGIRADSQFGLALTIGSGGIFVELIGDSSTLLLPTKLTDIEKSLKSLKLAKLLDGFRGKPKVNINLIAQEILKLALFAEKNINTIAEIEVNPMFVYEKSVVFVDVLIHAVKTEV
jgi:acyl-CoA synthetase (NDP forming)